ncbi:hypothetical protein [Caulobacter sp. CCG-8]|uniref:hypothetical protein n=1 Tax=Caulobacter sp. CCG-8 TaxID=3127958 RepID=UPI00307DCA1C
MARARLTHRQDKSQDARRPSPAQPKTGALQESFRRAVRDWTKAAFLVPIAESERMRQATTVTIRASRPPTEAQAYATLTLDRKHGPRAVAARRFRRRPTADDRS